MANKYSLGLDIAGGVGSGIYTGAQAAPFLANTLGLGSIGTAAGIGLGGALAIGSTALALKQYHEAKKAYRAKRDYIRSQGKASLANLARGHEMRGKQIEYGSKGAGGGHAVGVGREGTQQKHARTQQKEIAGHELAALRSSIRAQEAENRAMKYSGGSAQAAGFAQLLGALFKEFSEEPKTYKAPPRGDRGFWSQFSDPYQASNWVSP